MAAVRGWVSGVGSGAVRGVGRSRPRGWIPLRRRPPRAWLGAAVGAVLAICAAACGGAQGAAPESPSHRAATATPSIVAIPSVIESVSWSTTSSPNPPGSTGAWLYGLTCVSIGDCWAVGESDSGGSESNGQILFEHDTGSGWSITNSQAVPGSTSSRLQAMACADAEDCWAVGDYLDASGANHTLIEHYAGDGWTVDPSPAPAGDGEIDLDGVTCVSRSDCWAVGYSDASGPNSTGVGTVIEQYTGSDWTIVPSPSASGGKTDELAAVTCVSAEDCWAVGAYYLPGGGGDNQGLVEQYRGSGWSVVSSPLPPGSVESSLSSITCAGADDCWAVGGWGDVNYGGPTLIEQDTGSGWSIVPSPIPPGSTQSALSGVSCASPTDCWAVGFSGDESFNTAALIEQDRGTGWSIVSDTTPSGNAGGELLSGMTCMSSGHCVAVGEAGIMSSATGQTLIERA